MTQVIQTQLHEALQKETIQQSREPDGSRQAAAEDVEQTIQERELDSNQVKTFNQQLQSYKGQNTEDEADGRRSDKSNSIRQRRSIRTASERGRDYRLSSNIYNIAFGQLHSIQESIHDGAVAARPNIRIKSGHKLNRVPENDGQKEREEVLEFQINQIKSDLRNLRSRRVSKHDKNQSATINVAEEANFYDYYSKMSKLPRPEQLSSEKPAGHRIRYKSRSKEMHDIGILAKPTDPPTEDNGIIKRQLTFGGGGDLDKIFKAMKEQSKTKKDGIQTEQFVKLTRREDGSVQISLPSMQFPRLPDMPRRDSTVKELMQVGRKLFSSFGICGFEQKYTINISKYNNCVSFGAKGITILWYDTGRFYIGGYRMVKNEGQKHGKGIEYMPKRYLYDGEFKYNKKCGFGSLRYANGDSYEGQFYNGLKHGKGKLLQSNGVVYNGEWKNEKMDGFGILQLNNGDRYKGFFEGGSQQGHGLLKFQNGDEYKGQFLQGRFYGKGTYLWANGERYDGQFVNGSKHGKGTWMSSKDTPQQTYTGEYKNDKKCGYGKYIWADGLSFEGEFENDQRHGVGILTEKGKTTKGEWCNGKMEKCYDPQPKSTELQAYYSSAEKKKGTQKKKDEESKIQKRTPEAAKMKMMVNAEASKIRDNSSTLSEKPTRPMQFQRRMGQTS